MMSALFTAVAASAAATDPSWLLSTMAESSAALVGIIGGLLVSRVVALSAERSALSRQETELVHRRAQVSAELDARAQALKKDIEEDFRTLAPRTVCNRPDITVDGLLREHLDDRWHGDGDLRALAERVIDTVRRAYERCTDPEVQPFVDPDSVCELVEVPAGEEEVYREVARRVAYDRLEANGAFDRLLDPRSLPDLTRITETWEDMADADRTRRSEELADELRDIGIQLVSVRGSLHRIGDVRSLRPTFIALGIFAVVGIVQPVVMLAMRPVPAGTAPRVWIVTSFAAALVGLLFVLYREIRMLTSNGS
ncbi:MAG TPA: hypothetical protein VIL48_14050 [Acidimicrobiales bacterium]